MFVFGIDMPLPEILFIVIIILVAGLVFILFQMRQTNKHIKVLEDTTLQIRKYEEQEIDQVRRFETDMKNFESDEAQIFVARIVPTVVKIENHVASELLKGKSPEEIQAGLVKKGIKAELATKAVNSMTYYLDFFQKLPQKHMQSHVETANSIRVPSLTPKK